MKIRELDPKVIDQIAAGEVVERPAQLVKELVENSIDAGATRIDIEFDQGGRWLQVVDNGIGIEPDDLPRVFTRHATSKISSADDLWRLNTFGFRGEALASASAVSRISLVTKSSSAPTAYRLDREFGDGHTVLEVGGAQGTRILVQDLFENVPARLKFLKSEAGEAQAIKNVVKALALVHRNIEFRLKQKGRLIYSWPPAPDFKTRAEHVLEASPLYTEELSENGYRVEAAYAAPHHTLKQNRGIWIFVQNRWVVDKTLQAAVIDAYRGLLMHGEYPICVLRMECPPDEIDVNIHPTKSQVRFRQSSQAFRIANRCLRQGLEKAEWLKKAPEKSFSLAVTEPAPTNLGFSDHEFQRTQYATKSFDPTRIEEATQRYSSQAANWTEPARSSFAIDPSRSEFVRSERSVPVQNEESSGYWRRLQVLGQANLTYIIAQSDEGVVFVDQHAAHERVAYERLMEAWRGGRISVQQMLIPLTVEMDAEAVEAVLSQEEELQKMGLSVERSGPEALAINARPELVSDASLVRALQALADEIQERGGSFAFEKTVAHICATMACHSVVRAGQALSREEMQELLHQMDEYPLSSFCPHGRPVFVEYPFAKLEKDFGRIV